jgi:hypothetical protein
MGTLMLMTSMGSFTESFYLRQILTGRQTVDLFYSQTPFYNSSQLKNGLPHRHIQENKCTRNKKLQMLCIISS